MTLRLNFARFHGEIESLRARREQMRGALRERHADAAIRLADELVLEARRLAAANTGAFLSESDERKELEYLSANAAVLRSLLSNIDQNLKPVPMTAVRMFRTEITQGLYASVMGSNPSSTRREANPVESVTYADAEAFAARLGWLLGAKVRLPTPAEFAAAAGDLSKPPPKEQVWSAENTDGNTVRQAGSTAPNAAGFHDLVGNVEEWGLASPGETRAPVLGGSVATPFGKGLPSRVLHKREKNRTLGFRIVIE